MKIRCLVWRRLPTAGAREGGSCALMGNGREFHWKRLHMIRDNNSSFIIKNFLKEGKHWFHKPRNSYHIHCTQFYSDKSKRTGCCILFLLFLNKYFVLKASRAISVTAERLSQQKTDMGFCTEADYLARQATYLQNYGNKLMCTADKEISHR